MRCLPAKEWKDSVNYVLVNRKEMLKLFIYIYFYFLFFGIPRNSMSRYLRSQQYDFISDDILLLSNFKKQLCIDRHSSTDFNLK